MGEVFARRYELLDPIADGGMGSVWLVRDDVEGDVKVAKLLRHSDAGALLRFMREQSTRIHHPHVVTPLSWVGEDDTVLFTMPLVRGGSVATLIGDWGPLPESWTVAILEQTLDALDAVHAAGVVHRDVKPANLLLEPTGAERPYVRLTDFGIAAPLDQPRLTVAWTALGTPGYLAPESLAGADPAPSQDLYAVAATGLEMLLGHPPPFVEDEIPGTALGEVLRAAYADDPECRPDSARVLRDQVRQLAAPTWDAEGLEVIDHFTAQAAGPLTAVLSVAPPDVTARDAATSGAVAARAPAEGTARREVLGPLALAVLGVALLTLSFWLLFG